MKKTSFIFKFLCFSTIFLSSQVWANEMKSSHYGQVGLDVFGSSLKMPESYGGNVFAKSAPGMNIYFSKMFHDCFGVEVGYGAIKNRAKSSTIKADGDPLILGEGIILAADEEYYRTKIKLFQPYVGLFYNLPMNNKGSVFMQFLGGISLAQLKANLNFTGNKAAGVVTDFNDNAIIKKNKFAPILKLSLGGELSNNFGIRAFVSWTNLNIKKENIYLSVNKDSLTFKAKNAFNYGIGLIYNI